MPNCFQLISRETGKPEVLQTVDEKLCQHFGVPVHEKYWFYDWYNLIGFALATGKTFDEIIAWAEEEATSPKATEEDTKKYWSKQVEIARYLKERYESNAWAERRRT